MVAALWSNPNWDDTKEQQGTRTNAIKNLNEEFSEALDAIDAAFSNVVVEEEKKLSEDNPFFAAAERGLEKVESKVKKAKGDDYRSPDDEEFDYNKEIDQS